MSSVDPFGPSFSLECNICLNSTKAAGDKFQTWVILPCNLGKERSEAIDRILDELGQAWKDGKQLAFVNDWMQIDWDKLSETSLISPAETILFGPRASESHRLLTQDGYFSLDGLHGGCEGCIREWRQQKAECQTCKNDINAQFVSKYLNQKAEKGHLDIQRPSSLNPSTVRPMTAQVGSFFDDVKGMFTGFGRSVIGGAGKDRGDHLQAGMHRLDRIVSIAINGLIHNVLFHSAVKVALISFQSFGFKGLNHWLRFADDHLEWNLSWTKHVLIWKAFVSAFDYKFSSFSVNTTYAALTHHVNRLDLLGALWLSFKVMFRADFSWTT